MHIKVQGQQTRTRSFFIGTFAAALALPACSDAGRPSRTGTSSEGLEYIVTLPNKLGKNKQITHHPVTTPATQRYTLGLNPPTSKKASGPGVKTQDAPTADELPK